MTEKTIEYNKYIARKRKFKKFSKFQFSNQSFLLIDNLWMRVARVGESNEWWQMSKQLDQEENP